MKASKGGRGAPSLSSGSILDLSYLFVPSSLNREWNGPIVADGVHALVQKHDSSHVHSTSAKKVMATWNWGHEPDERALRECAKAIVKEQGVVCADAANTTLFSARIRRRLIMLKRHVKEARRAQREAREKKAKMAEVADEEKDIGEKRRGGDTKQMKSKRKAVAAVAAAHASSGQRATQGLARLGSRAALSFAFAFLRRAWRSGEDGDLCSDLLEESLDALLTLPEASMFHAESFSGVWMEVVERTSKFLRSVVTGESGIADVPKHDRHLALNLLFEFSVQKGTLSEMLDTVMLLFHIWHRERGLHEADNRECIDSGTSAPLIGFLKRLEAIEPCCNNDDFGADGEEWDDYENVSATQCFLKYLEYPDLEETPIDLKQTAVVIMSHLDRLTIPHQPVLEQNTVSEICPKLQCRVFIKCLSFRQFCTHATEIQEVRWLGQVAWGRSDRCSQQIFGKTDVAELSAYHRGLLGISRSSGRMFYCTYDGGYGGQVQYVDSDHRFNALSTSYDGHFAVALTEGRNVMQFELQSSVVSVGSDTVRLNELDDKDIVAVSAGSGHL
jgi:hypothetical protein